MSDPFSFSSEGEPSEIILGTYVSWRTDYTHDPVLYRMEYVLRGATPVITTVGAFVDGVWTFTILGATSVAWVSGIHSWDLNLVRLSDSEKLVCASGFMTFIAAADDRRTKAKVMLDKIDSILSNRADDDVESYSIGSRSITKMSLEELMTWRDHYRSEVAREEAGGRTPTLKVRFI